MAAYAAKETNRAKERIRALTKRLVVGCSLLFSRLAVSGRGKEEAGRMRGIEGGLKWANR
jgi:hypothetical protein